MKRRPPETAADVRYRRVAELDGLEYLRAAGRRHRFARHSHDTFSIGLVERGANGFLCRGRSELAPAGTVCIVNAGDVHTGGEAGPWSYWNLYPSAAWVEAVAVGLGRRAGVPVFPSAVIRDRAGAELLRRLFASLDGPATRLERETRLVRALGHLVRCHAEAPPRSRTPRPEPARVARARDYLAAHLAENVSLAELAQVAELSPFHLLRQFRRTFGLPPHAYQVQLRVRRAKDLVLGGMGLAEAALEAGFADQAHLTRRFKAILGFTPGGLRRRSSSVQDPVTAGG